EDRNSAAVGAPNVVNVAATDFNGRLAKFSNVSNQEVEIAAPGVAVVSSIPGGGRIRLSGTSMATPVVTNRLVDILSRNPGMTVEQAIAELFGNQSALMADLNKAVQDGRFLLPRGLVGVAPRNLTSIEGVDQERYFDAEKCRQALEADGDRIRP